MAPNPCAHCRSWPRNRIFCTPREFDCQNFVGTRHGQYDPLEGRLPRSPNPCDYCSRKRKRLACSTADPSCQNRILLDQCVQLSPSDYHTYQHGMSFLQLTDTAQVKAASEGRWMKEYNRPPTEGRDYSVAQGLFNRPAMVSEASMSGPVDGDLMEIWFSGISRTESQMIIDDAFKDGCFSAQESLVRADQCARDHSDRDLWMTKQNEIIDDVDGTITGDLGFQSAHTFPSNHSECAYTGTNPHAARTGGLASSVQYNDQSPLLFPSKEYSEFSSYTGTNPHVKRAVQSPHIKKENEKSGLDVQMVFSGG